MMTAVARPDPARLDRRIRCSALLLAVFLSGYTSMHALPAIAGTPESAESDFRRYDVVAGAAKRPTVLTGFLFGGAVAELAVVHIDRNDERRLRIFAFDGDAWVPRLDATLGPEVSFVDVARIGGRDRLVTYEPGRLSWFDPESKTERALVAVTSDFNPPRSGEIAHVDVTRDLNDDGRDDLVVPGAGGFRVFVQRSDGAFADPVKIGRSPELAGIYGADGYRYDPWSQSRVHEVDIGRDGRSDLVFWNQDHFEVHHQDERGLFAPTAETFTTAVAFDSDDLFSLAVGDMTGKVLHSLIDLNGDGVADLVVFSLEGRRISRKRSAYEVHFGAPAPGGGTVFARDADLVIRSDGIQLGLDPYDFDRDGQVDLMITVIKRRFLRNNLWMRFSGFMGGEVHLQLEFYRMKDGFYADEPDATRRIELQFPGAHRGPGWVPLDLALRGGTHESRNTRQDYARAFNTPVLVGDVTGDDRLDLLIGWDRKSLPGLRRHPADLFRIDTGVPGSELFSLQPKDLVVPMPRDGEYTWLVDLDKDGKQDILLHYPFATEPHRVTLLIAR